MRTCRRGYILRNGYTRTLKNKKIRVPSGCIKAQSETGLKTSIINEKIIAQKNKMHELVREHFKPKCSQVREGYIRNTYTRKNGTVVASSIVPPKCIKRKGKPLFILPKDELNPYGYHINKTEKQRHKSLHMALQDIKPLSLYRTLNALYVVNKHNENGKIFKMDAEWLKTTDEYIHRSFL